MDQAIREGRDAAPGGFDVRMTRALGHASQAGRVVFAAIFALISLTFLPWTVPAAWIAAVVAWELVNPRILDGYVVKQPQERAITAYAVCNAVGAVIFQTLALLSLANGSPVGAALGVAWISGAFTNNFVYFGATRRTLWSALIPGIAAAVAGPLIAYGPGLQALAVTGFILCGLLAARAYALDRRSVLDKLADRQVALADVERKLSVAIDAAGDGLFEMVLLPKQAFYGDANWLAMLGYGPGEISMPVADWRSLIHPDDRPALDAEYERHLAGETTHTTSEMRLLCKDGGYKWVLSRGRLVERAAGGAPLRIIGTAIDISARKALEQDLEAARDEAESANRAKSVFVANMSHEIRTPLNGVVGLAGALARTRLSRGQREMVSLIQSSGQVLDRLLTDILDQAKIEAGDFALQAAPFDLRRELDSAAELMRARADEKGLAFTLAYADAARGVFEGDAVRVRQIVSNLTSNAIKFTEAGSVRIAVDVEPGEGVDWLTVAVADTGIGIEPAAAGRLFQRFRQADESISRQYGGTGLGLSISRTLAELMGGGIEVQSDVGRGSTFTVRIPLKRAQAEDGADGAVAAEALARLQGLHVLLAEDHPVNQKVVQLILEPLGVRLSIVENGQAAIEAHAAGAFDLVLMDMQMPVMDGIAAVTEIRRREADTGAPRTPIAMLTANASEEHRGVGEAAGADCHVAKPITPETLIAGIAATLASGGRRRAATAAASVKRR